MQELSRQLLSHIEEVRTTDRDGREVDIKQVQKLKQELQSLESQLNAERILHGITKTSRQHLEEDCARLRQQIHAMRRKGYGHDRYMSESKTCDDDLAKW